jgi:hypothetical protein
MLKNQLKPSPDNEGDLLTVTQLMRKLVTQTTLCFYRQLMRITLQLSYD